MANKPRRDAAIEGRTIAEHCPRSRVRLKRIVCPGFQAYLIMMGLRATKQIEILKAAMKVKDFLGGKEAIAEATMRAKICEDMARRLYDTFDRDEWLACMEAVRESYSEEQRMYLELLCEDTVKDGGPFEDS